jgi:hypothetical protein
MYSECYLVSAEHARNFGDVRSDKDFYNSLSRLDIVRKCLLKDIGLDEGDELDLIAMATPEGYICARRNHNL